MATRGTDHGSRLPIPYRALAGFIVACAAFAAVFVALAVGAYHAPRPHDLPVGIVASATATGGIEHALDSALPGAISWRSYPSAADARTGIVQREVDGALVASGSRLGLLVATGGGTAPANFLTQAAGTVAARSGSQLAVTDVVPALPGDTQALSSFFILLGALIPSLAAGSGTALAFRKARPALGVGAPVAVAVAIGLVSAAVADGIAGLGHYPAIAGVVALFSLAVAAPTAVLARIKPPLVGLAVLLFIVAGIPDSGGPANLASFSGAGFRLFDSVLPLGLAASVVRNVVYFGGHSTALHLWILAAWAVAGLAGLIALAARRRPAPALTAAGRPPVVPAAVPGVVPGVVPAAPRHARPEPAPVPGAPFPGGPDHGGTDYGAVEPISLIVGFDNSEPARRALIWGADLLRARPGTLHVVYADHPLIDSDLSGFGRAQMDEARDDKAAGVARAVGEIAAAAGVPYTFERRQESPADAILSAANLQDDAEPASEPIIVTGRSHHAPHRILGSVPVELLHQSPFPVLTIS
jgi:nucleotide-binding universal stress UspA family protein